MSKRAKQRQRNKAPILYEGETRRGPDRGTPEARIKRMMLAGATLEAAVASLVEEQQHPATAERLPEVPIDFPLDILRDLGLITDAMREAGNEFARLAWRLYSRPTPRLAALWRQYTPGLTIDAADDPIHISDEMPEEREARESRNYRRMIEELYLPGEHGQVLHAVKKTAVEMRIPNIIRLKDPDDKDELFFENLIVGLWRLVPLHEKSFMIRKVA